MYRFSNPMGRKYVLIAAFVSVFIASALARAQVEKDPHRPACTDARCRKVRSFLKANYCGASPFGNGPDDGCEIKDQGKPRPGVGVLADYRCEWDQSEQAIQCEQHGEPTPALRKLLVGELHGIGLPANANGQTFFKVWKSGHSGWSIAEGYYSRSAGSDVELCEVIIVIDDSSRRIRAAQITVPEDRRRRSYGRAMGSNRSRRCGRRRAGGSHLRGRCLRKPLARSGQRAGRKREDNLFWARLLPVIASARREPVLGRTALTFGRI